MLFQDQGLILVEFEFGLTRQGPFSSRSPSIDEEPGPPLSLRRGSVLGSHSFRCTRRPQVPPGSPDRKRRIFGVFPCFKEPEERVKRKIVLRPEILQHTRREVNVAGVRPDSRRSFAESGLEIHCRVSPSPLPCPTKISSLLARTYL